LMLRKKQSCFHPFSSSTVLAFLWKLSSVLLDQLLSVMALWLNTQLLDLTLYM
jgi:hypothetical protein